MVRCVSNLSVLRFMLFSLDVEWCMAVLDRCCLVAVATDDYKELLSFW